MGFWGGGRGAEGRGGDGETLKDTKIRIKAKWGGHDKVGRKRKLKLKCKRRREDGHPGRKMSNHLSSREGGKTAKKNACSGPGWLHRKCPPVDLFSAGRLPLFYGSQIAGRFEPVNRSAGGGGTAWEGEGGGSFEALASPLGLHNVHTCDRRRDQVRAPAWTAAPPREL